MPQRLAAVRTVIYPESATPGGSQFRSQQVATLPQGEPPYWRRWGERTRLRALRVAFGNVPSEASPLRCMSSASRVGRGAPAHPLNWESRLPGGAFPLRPN